jgi:hypothetical protein
MPTVTSVFINYSFFRFLIASSSPTKCRMTLSSTFNPASGRTIPTGKDEVSLYLHGSEELDVNAALAWWRQHVSSFDCIFSALLLIFQ